MALNKLLPIFFSPIVLVCLAIVVGAVLRQRRWSIAAAVLLLVSSLPIVADRLFAWSQSAVIDRSSAGAPQSALPSAEAIVVSGGAMTYVRPDGVPIAEWGGAVDRLFGGIALAQEGRAPRLIFSGGSWIGQEGLPSEGAIARQFAIGAGVPADRVEVSPQVLNTQQEAEVIRPMFTSVRPRIVLVTSAFHMPRAVVTFESAGFEVIAHPVDFRAPVRRTVLTDWLPKPEALEKTDIVIRELIGRAFYRARAAFQGASE